jgi:predicted nucleic acid-binding protein
LTLYVDTSAVVKLYAAEPGSAETRREVGEASRVVSSLLTYVETRSALARKYHSGEIVATAFETGKADFEADWRIFIKIPPDAVIVRRAGDLAEQFRLRAYDAIHLASAEQIFRDTRSQVRFACFDAALNRAALTLGLIPVPD